MTNRGILISRLSQPVTISYDGQAFLLPPQGKSKPIEGKLLGAIPKGVVFVLNKEEDR